MPVPGVHKWVVGALLAGGAAVVFGAGAASADDGTISDINGWAVTLTGGDGSDSLLPAATLSDPSNSLGLGTEPITGSFGNSTPPIGDIGSDEIFNTPLSTVGTADYLNIQDNWFSGFEIASVQPGQDDGAVMSFLMPAAGGKDVVDLFNYGTPTTVPLFNPDATGPIDIGGLPLADPQDGALFNDLGGALFDGNATDWSHAMTLLGDLVGSSTADATSSAGAAAADAVDPSGWLDLVNLF